MNTEFIVMTASEKMPSSCWGKYGRVAVVEVEEGLDDTPKMISERAKGVVRIVENWRRLNVGKTDKCAFRLAEEEAYELCAKLNDVKDYLR
jgi:hypothetical protein